MSEDGSDSSDLNKSTNPPGTGTRSSVAGTGGAATPPDIVMKHAPGSWQALAAGEFVSDGRNVDTRRAELSGEAADLDAGSRVGDRGHLGDPSQTTVAEEASKRVVKASRWTWEVPAYFAIGGMAGAAATLSAGAQLAKLGGTDRRMVQSGRLIALGGTVVGSVLLVADLGRPERFWHMLRVFRPSSATPPALPPGCSACRWPATPACCWAPPPSRPGGTPEDGCPGCSSPPPPRPERARWS